MEQKELLNLYKKNIDICDLVINVQGDEPYINPIHIDLCIRNYFKEKYNIELNVLQTQFHNKEDIKCITLCHVLKTNELKVFHYYIIWI